MPRILIVDSEPAAVNARKRARYGASTGEAYGQELKGCGPGVEIEIAAPYDDPRGLHLDGVDGVVFTGSAVDWTTDDPKAAPLAKAMEAAFAQSIPCFGSCNGLLLAASVLGGASQPSPNGREDGLARDIRLTEAGKRHPLLKDRKDGYAAPCVHRDEVTRLPEGAVVLASNAHSPVQAMAYERDGIRFWGVQYHPEYPLPYIGARVLEWERLPADTAADLHCADTDPTAADRLDVRFSDMQPGVRTTELRNWLASL